MARPACGPGLRLLTKRKAIEPYGRELEETSARFPESENHPERHPLRPCDLCRPIADVIAQVRRHIDRSGDELAGVLLGGLTNAPA